MFDHDLPAAVEPGVRYELVSNEEAPLLAIRRILGLARYEPLPPLFVKLGTTRGTNALLTRTGARTAFVTTAGFGDVQMSARYECYPERSFIGEYLALQLEGQGDAPSARTLRDWSKAEGGMFAQAWVSAVARKGI